MTKSRFVVQRVKSDKPNYAHVVKQSIATIASCSLIVCGGLGFGFSAVLLPQLDKEESIKVTEDTRSWIASIFPLSMVVGCLCAGTILDIFGRKLSHIIIAIPCFIGWLFLGLSTNITHILISRILTGASVGAMRPTCAVYLGEITDPNYRSLTLLSTSMAMNLGNMLSHAIGNFIYWRTASYIFCAPLLLSFTVILFLKESPLWLISKGKIDSGIESFRFFRGNGEKPDEELKAVLEKHNKDTTKMSFSEVCKTLFSKSFMKPMVTVFFLYIAVQFCGINTISFYTKDLLEKTFSNSFDPFIVMMLIDTIRLSVSILVCVFSKYLPQKLILIFCGFGTTGFLTVLILALLYLKSSNMAWVHLLCLLVYISLSSCIVSISWSIFVEIFPSNIRGLGSGIGASLSFVFLFISVKFTPIILSTYGEEAMYGTFAVCTFVATVFLCFMVPDTKGKTLQEIEESYVKK